MLVVTSKPVEPAGVGRLKAVSVIVEVRSLYQEGLNKTQIAARLGIHRETVSKYLAMEEIPMERTRKAGSRKIDAYRAHMAQRLEKYPDLSAQQLYREIRNQGYQGSARTVRRALARMRKKAPARRYRPVITLPAEQAQVDWGHCGRIMVEGKSLPLYAFVFTLSYSRWVYVEFTVSQDMATFLGCHHRAFVAAGGVPAEIVYDNAKTVTASRVGHVVQFTEGLLRFAAGYGFGPRACWVRDPESKGRVENRVKFVKRSFVYGYEVTTLEAINADGQRWCQEVANGEVCAATGMPPEAGLAEERAGLRPLPARPVEVPEVADRGVSKTGIIHWHGNLYSVPECVQGCRVQVHGYEDRLEIFHERQRIAVLPRVAGKGQTMIRDEHYGPRNGPASRGERLQQEFEAIGPLAAEYLRGLARARGSRVREHAESILGLCERYGTEAVHQAMERAANFGAYGYGILKRIVEQTAANPQALPEVPAAAETSIADRVPSLVVEQRSLEYYADGGER